jgi:asparagine synthetase B (glutamine-hydrolysing)
MPPTECITFKLKNYKSPDLIASTEVCKKLNLKLTAVEIPDDVPTIYQDCREIISITKSPLKTHVQSCWPYKYMLPAMTTRQLVAGTWSGYFLTMEKKANINARNMKPDEFKQWYHDYRKTEWYKPGHSFESMKKYIQHIGVKFIEPYYDDELMELALKLDYYDWNFNLDGTCKHKYLQYMMFKDWFDKIGVWRRQSSMQIVNGIRTAHEQMLLDKTINRNNNKDLRAVYGQILKEVSHSLII